MTEATHAFAIQRDEADPLKHWRSEFHIPTHEGKEVGYFCGNSLGLQPKATKDYVEEALEDWATMGVHAHTDAAHPWVPYHEYVAGPMAEIVGAKPEEVVAMNSLTVNLHLLMVSFYRPSKKRFKILMEKNAFPSDQYAIQSQVKFHGFVPEDAIIEVAPLPGEDNITTEQILEVLENEGETIALVMFSGVFYLTGQVFDMGRITDAAHGKGCMVGFDLAHAAGNVLMSLHDWEVDFAAWCNYKYLNAGPGGIAGCFVHEKHLGDESLPRFNGWWGQNKARRFLMEEHFDPIPTAEAWQLSNPPILQLAALRASMAQFSKAGMAALREKGDKLFDYLRALLQAQLPETVRIMTPLTQSCHGNQMSLSVKGDAKDIHDKLNGANMVVDFREPHVIRVAPVPFYNRFQDVFNFVQTLEGLLK